MREEPAMSIERSSSFAWLLLLIAGCAGFEGAPSKGESAETLSNTLRWSTTEASRCAGFDVYRAPAGSDDFSRITASPLPCSAAGTGEASYDYVDPTIERGRAYRYYVESIGQGGERSRLTPILTAPAKPTAP
jgi:hypothetical protein